MGFGIIAMREVMLSYGFGDVDCACGVSLEENIMKSLACLVVATSVLASGAFADGFSVGAHGAYTLGGDVESEEFGYGGQVSLDVCEGVSVELSGTMFSDEVDADELGNLDIDAQHIALSGRYDLPVSDAFGVYVGAGVSYNMFDVDEPSLQELIGGGALDPAEAQAYADFITAGGTTRGTRGHRD